MTHESNKDAPGACPSSPCSLCDEPGADSEEWFPGDGIVHVHSKCFAIFAMAIESSFQKLGMKCRGVDVDGAIRKANNQDQAQP